MALTIKKFEELSVEQLYEILRIRSEVFVVEQKCIYQDLDLKDKKSYHIFKEENGEIISYIRVIPKGISYDQMSIGRVLVREEYRGKGLAREILLEGINFIKNTLKENEIKISAQSYLIDFYKSIGFIQKSQPYLEDNIPHVKMVYTIK